MKRVVVSLLCSSWLVACGGAPPDGSAAGGAVSQQARAVSGVQPVNSPFGSVGTLTQGRTTVLCSATLVAARTVIASARCAANATHFVMFDGEQMARFHVETRRLHPSYSPGQASYDVAVVRLAEQPSAARPSPVLTSSPRLGTGVDIPGDPLVKARIARVGPLLLQTRAATVDRVGACPASAGMPVFADLGHRRVLVGLLSEAPGSACGLALRLDAVLSWLQKASEGEIELLDTVAPTLAIDRPTDGGHYIDHVQVLAFAADDRGLESVAMRIDGTIRGVSDSGDVRFDVDLDPGIHVIELEARDLSGNTRVERVRVTMYGSATPDTHPALKQIESNSSVGDTPGSRVTTVYGGCSAAGSPARGDVGLLTMLLLAGVVIARRRRTRR